MNNMKAIIVLICVVLIAVLSVVMRINDEYYDSQKTIYVNTNKNLSKKYFIIKAITFICISINIIILCVLVC
jgi:cell division protein FtsW (lipid II flippase)